MTLEEAAFKCNNLSKINLDIWNARTAKEKKVLKQAFRDACNEIIAAGFKIKHRKIFSDKYNKKIPFVYPAINKNAGMVSINNNRSTNAKYDGDCTTRAICFCTGEDYDTIQKEQFYNSKHMFNGWCSWRNNKIWSVSLMKRGYAAIELKRHVSRATFIKMMSGKIDSGIIAARSSGHVAAIDMAKKQILDMWDCSNGRILCIYVPANQEADYRIAMKAKNII